MKIREMLLRLVDKFFPPNYPGGHLEVSDQVDIMTAASQFPYANIHWPCHYKASAIQVGIMKGGVDAEKVYIRFFDPSVEENFICLLDGAARNALIDLANDISYCYRKGSIKKV